MAHAVREKQCRMDLRLTQSQRASYETAAALRGQTLSQWSTRILDDAATNDIEYFKQTKLSDEAFERLCEILEEPMPKATQNLLAREEIWK